MARNMKISEIKRLGYSPEESIYYDVICRTIAAPVAKFFMILGLRANTVTAGMILFGIASGACLARGYFVFGLVLMHIFLIIDASDGYIAKASDDCSLTGLYLDHLGHYVAHPAFIAGLSAGLFAYSGSMFVLVAGLIAAWANVVERSLRDTYNYVFYKNVCRAGLKYESVRVRGTSFSYRVRSFVVGMMDFPFILNAFTIAYVVGLPFTRAQVFMSYVMIAYGFLMPLYVFYSVVKSASSRRLDVELRGVIGSVKQ